MHALFVCRTLQEDVELCVHITERLLKLVVSQSVTLDSNDDTVFFAMQAYLLVMEIMSDQNPAADIPSIGQPLIKISADTFAAFDSSTITEKEITVSRFLML